MTKHKNSTLAGFTYLVFFLPMITGEKNDPFVRYHMKQAIGLLITVLAVQGAIRILAAWGLGYGGLNALAWGLRIYALVSVVLGFSSAQRGEMKPLFWIGNHAAKI
ncbi:MAG: hypothetical protein G01um101420_42 [Parcubacteria group bacterium Gr01-1014_20]|nr:MAG: hypothetical protein G01um101420_42 [Parcubacteria group bacterium Gr01-1014_20]